jgi:hypothetical protein
MDKWTDKSKDPNGCWIWTGNARKGYGLLSLNGGTATVLVHRLAWTLENGPIPEGLFVCHHCDNARCWRVSHLFLGTAKDNNQDASRKGRNCRGERRSNAKLTDDAVRAIRTSTESAAALSIRYGVTDERIRLVRLRRLWHHVPDVATSPEPR